MENLNELQLSQSPTVSAAKKEEPVQASDNKLSYEAQKEQNKKIRKLEKQVADCETLIERLEKEVAELEERMATPEGASDMKLYEQHQQLKNRYRMLKKNGRMFLLNWKNLKVKTANYN